LEEGYALENGWTRDEEENRGDLWWQTRSTRLDVSKFKFNRKTRAYEESLNDEKFVKLFTRRTVKGWKGLKLKYLQDMLLVEYPEDKAETELEYSTENSLTLVENSTEFDNWLNEVVFDLENFRSREPEKGTTKTDAVSG
jgi:hypothetical protein